MAALAIEYFQTVYRSLQTNTGENMFEAFLRPMVFGPLFILVILIIHSFSSRSKLHSLPLLNSRKGEWFPYYRTRFRNTTALKDALRLASEKHKNETVLLAVGGHTDLALLPNHETTVSTEQDSCFDSLTADSQYCSGSSSSRRMF